MFFFWGGRLKTTVQLVSLLEMGESYVAYRFFGSIFLVHFCMDFWSEALGRRALTLVGAYETAAWHDENWVSKMGTDEFDVFYSFNKFSVTYA